MTSKLGVRAEFTEFDMRVGQAWSQHNAGQYEAAIAQYYRLLDEWPDHIDANYGLALALKAAGQKDKAREAFKKTFSIVETEQAKMTGDTARYQMLRRILENQLRSLE